MMQHDLVTEADARHRARQLLSRPAYRRLWLARTISQVGDVAQFTTLALLLIALTGSGLGVSGAVLAEIAPVLLLAPLAGSLVDRLPRVRVMVAADLARVLLPAVLSVWHDNVAVAYAVAFGLSAGQVFFSPAAQSLLPAAVEDDELVAANSGIWTAAVTAQIIVAPVAAVIAVQVGFGAAFAVNSASFALSALVLRGLRGPARPTAVSVSSPFVHAREALTALTGIPLLKALAAGQFLALSHNADRARFVATEALRTFGPRPFAHRRASAQHSTTDPTSSTLSPGLPRGAGPAKSTIRVCTYSFRRRSPVDPSRCSSRFAARSGHGLRKGHGDEGSDGNRRPEGTIRHAATASGEQQDGCEAAEGDGGDGPSDDGALAVQAER